MMGIPFARTFGRIYGGYRLESDPDVRTRILSAYRANFIVLTEAGLRKTCWQWLMEEDDAA